MNFRNLNIFSIIKFFLEIGVLILFIGSFYKLFLSVPDNLILKIIYTITYIWFTVGINVNFIMPLLGMIDKQINKH